ncbi:Uncharacterised protein [Yersinia frederiksenii]|nr:Uncharacterised protein [Yersinia frederiksenii]CNJ30565.1 Uncharacterised protein [Yersinia frederiksenii]CNK47550.1 Uncharacterised protein [Yersinia frederiksenii]
MSTESLSSPSYYDKFQLAILISGWNLSYYSLYALVIRIKE